jgi:hypothetical protein
VRFKQKKNVPHGKMKKVVELVLLLPGSNVSIETVFPRMIYIWSEEKHRFYVDTIQTILPVKTNIDLSREEFSKNLQQILEY